MIHFDTAPFSFALFSLESIEPPVWIGKNPYLHGLFYAPFWD